MNVILVVLFHYSTSLISISRCFLWLLPPPPKGNHGVATGNCMLALSRFWASDNATQFLFVNAGLVYGNYTTDVACDNKLNITRRQNSAIAWRHLVCPAYRSMVSSFRQILAALEIPKNGAVSLKHILDRIDIAVEKYSNALVHDSATEKQIFKFLKFGKKYHPRDEL